MASPGDADELFSGNLFHDLSDDDLKDDKTKVHAPSATSAPITLAEPETQRIHPESQHINPQSFDEGANKSSDDSFSANESKNEAVATRDLDLFAAFAGDDDGFDSDADDDSDARMTANYDENSSQTPEVREQQLEGQEEEEDTAMLPNPVSLADAVTNTGGRSIDDEVRVEQKLDRFLSTLKFQYNGLHAIRNMSVTALKVLMFVSVISRGILNLGVAVYNMVILYDGNAFFGFTGSDSVEQEDHMRDTFKWLVFGLEVATLSFLFMLKNYCLFSYVFKRHSPNITRRKLGLYLYFTSHLLNYVASFSALKFTPSTTAIVGFFTVNLKRSYTINSVKVGSTVAFVWCFIQGFVYIVLRAFGVIVFLTKLQQLDFVASSSVLNWTDRDWLMVLAFMNNVMSVANVKQLQMDVLMQLIFSGGDAEMSAKEFWYQQTTLSLIAIRLIETHGGVRGAVLLLNLSHADIQRLLLSEEGRGVAYKTNISTDTSVNSRSSPEPGSRGFMGHTELQPMSSTTRRKLEDYRRHQRRFDPVATRFDGFGASSGSADAFYQGRATRQTSGIGQGTRGRPTYSYRYGDSSGSRVPREDQRDICDEIDKQENPYSYV